ncbi:hypothetical protein [Simonsiella muelleri]|nr:hypothetical protein [Simonsiella muelleri]
MAFLGGVAVWVVCHIMRGHKWRFGRNGGQGFGFRIAPPFSFQAA